MKLSESYIKQGDRFTYVGRMRERNSKIQNEINRRIIKATQSYHLRKRILWDRVTEISVKPQYTRYTLRRYYDMEWSHGHAQREGKQNASK
jgi:hypothetical protein